MLDLFDNEIKIMELINHPRILKLYDKFKIMNSIGLVTKYCDGGNLEELIIKNNKFGIGVQNATFYLK